MTTIILNYLAITKSMFNESPTNFMHTKKDAQIF
jgi:hypothetical protein